MVSNPVTRRYTPPTCTLQIVDRNSPLSRHLGHSITPLSQFELHLDDPRLPEEKRFSIQGDQDQLTALHEAVTNYVQEFLNQAPEQSNVVASQASTTTSSDPVTSANPQLPDEITLDEPATAEEPQLLNPRPSDQLDININEITPQDGFSLSRKIFLQPGTRLSHKLFLGSLATNKTGQVIELSTLQLFDLATALDENANYVAIPTFNRPPRAASTPSTTWASIAAMLLVAVGLTAAVVQLLNRSTGERQIANRGVIPPSSNQQQQIVPSSPTPPLSSSLPSLPPVNSTDPLPTANLPSVNVPATTPPLLQGTPPLPPPQSTITSVPSVGAPNTTPVSPILRTTTPPSVLINPYPGQSNSTSTPGGTAIPGNSAVPIPKSPANIDKSPTAPSAAKQDDTTQGSSLNDTPTVEQRLNAALAKRSPRTQTTLNQPQSPALVAAATQQLTQAKDYFSQRWEPPSGLAQTLEYSIVLDVDGSIQRIEPLGQAARTYVDRTGMPLIGERFVSPNPGGQTPRIRVVLGPDGKVQTFLEEEQGSSQARPSQNSTAQERKLPF